MILNQSQAEAVYSAMCALNNVGMDTFRASFPGQPGRRSGGKSHVYVEASTNGVNWPLKVSTYCQLDVEDNYTETYTDQSSFATAYGLQ